MRRALGSTLFPYTTLFRSNLSKPSPTANESRRDPAVADVNCRQTSVARPGDRKSTRLNSSHSQISYAVFCWKKQTDDLASGHQVDDGLHRYLHAAHDLPAA